MAILERHSPGNFCWIELATSDQNAAKKFYGSLFGWKVEDFPMGPNEVYSMFSLEGRRTGAAYSLRPEHREQGIPPHWQLYVAVASADATAAKVAQLGGKLVDPAFDVMDVGRMAVIQDPTGAVFAIWEAKRSAGTGIAGVDGTFCWADLYTPDREKAGTFYKGLFGWELMTEPEDHSGYTHIENGATPIGGIPPAGRAGNAPPHWMIYIQTSDCPATAAKAEALGAKTRLAPLTIPGVGTMAILADPQGAVFALFQSARASG